MELFFYPDVTSGKSKKSDGTGKNKPVTYRIYDGSKKQRLININVFGDDRKYSEYQTI